MSPNMSSSKPAAAASEKNHRTPDPNAYGNYQREIYSSLHGPLFSTRHEEWERLARKKIPAANFGYVFYSAGNGQTDRANREAFDRYRLRPRMLVDSTTRDVHVDLFGERHPSPLLAAPVGVQNILHRDAEEATARACRALQIPIILSTAAARTIEEVARANGGGGRRWFQLYWPRSQDEDVTASLLKRARESGFSVLVVTLDATMLGWRPADLDTAYLPSLWGDGSRIGLSDPVFNRKYEEMLARDVRSAREKMQEALDLLRRPGSVYGALKILRHGAALKKVIAWLDVVNSGTYRKWEDLAILKRHWDGPIVLKGIQTVEDAHLAVDYGMEGIIVSNHGGRQVNGAIASLDALAEIAADSKVRASGITLLFDSGVRTGSDVLKALALGAKAVLIGRPYIYGLAIAGEAGVKHVFRSILADMDITLANIGKASIAEMNRNDLQHVQFQEVAKL